MRYDVVLLRYGELALKGKNRGQFENRLLANVRQALADFPGLRVRRAYGRLLVELGDAPFAEVAERLGRVFGSCRSARRCARRSTFRPSRRRPWR